MTLDGEFMYKEHMGGKKTAVKSEGGAKRYKKGGVCHNL